MLDRLDQRAIERLSGPGWVPILPTIQSIHGAIIGVSPTVRGELTTIYIKYTSGETGVHPFAVLWVKMAAEIVLGLSLPPGISVPPELAPVARPRYKGLTEFVRLGIGDRIPDGLDEWIAIAYRSSTADE